METRRNRKLILEIAVTIDPVAITALHGRAGEEVLVIPFGGTARGAVFNGTVCPGAADVQIVNPAGVRHMFARYMLRGTDAAGESCSLYVENHGWFSAGLRAGAPFDTAPEFYTDSRALGDYLRRGRFVGEGLPDEQGIRIRFYELTEEA